MGRQSDAKERLIRSAGDLWHARSYADVGVSEICTHAGVQKGSFYHFFESKRDLALAVIDDRWHEVGVKIMGPILTSDAPPLERVMRYLQTGLEAQRHLKRTHGTTLGCSFGNMVVEMATVDEGLRQRLSQLFDDWAAQLQGALDDAVAAGDLPEIDTALASRALLAYIEGLSVIVKAENDPGAVEDLLPLALRLVGADPAAVRQTPATA